MRLSRIVSKAKAGDFQSAEYWQKRYAAGRNSGSGSYGRLAEYKAGFINALVTDQSIKTVIEFGSGDGNQASLFNFAGYTGVDVVPQVVGAAQARFADRPGWSFRTTDQYAKSPTHHEMAMSLDVIYHLVEDAVFDRYMRTLVEAATRFVLIYASDHDEAAPAKHVRHRQYSRWMAENAPRFGNFETFDHPYPYVEGADRDDTSFAFFRLYALSGAKQGAGG